MIVCHRYKFIFIKPRKAASTSVEIALSRLCDAADIVTPLSREDELLRQSEGGQGPVNYRPRGWYIYPGYWAKALRDRKAPRAFKGHTPACRARECLADSVWQTYTKISVTRNPWDMAVSHYYWRLWELNKRGYDVTDFSLNDYITYLYTYYPKWLTNWYRMADKGELLIDRVLRYEHLADDITELGQSFGLTDELRLPRIRAKGQHRQDQRNYRELLGEQERRMIEAAAKSEIEAFNHSW